MNETHRGAQPETVELKRDQATENEVAAARAKYGNEDPNELADVAITVDEDALASRCLGGHWIQGWLWMPKNAAERAPMTPAKLIAEAEIYERVAALLREAAALGG